MITNEGRKVDEYLTVERKPAVLQATVLRNFNYAECVDCHHFIELSNGRSVSELVQDDVTRWQFGLMGLMPSWLKVAKGICPICQEMRKQFKGILEA